MREITTYSKGAPFYNAFLSKRNNDLFILSSFGPNTRFLLKRPSVLGALILTK